MSLISPLLITIFSISSFNFLSWWRSENLSFNFISSNIAKGQKILFFITFNGSAALMKVFLWIFILLFFLFLVSISGFLDFFLVLFLMSKSHDRNVWIKIRTWQYGIIKIGKYIKSFSTYTQYCTMSFICSLLSIMPFVFISRQLQLFVLLICCYNLLETYKFLSFFKKKNPLKCKWIENRRKWHNFIVRLSI